MVSVEDVSVRLEESVRDRQILNEGSAPNAGHQDEVNTELREANVSLSQRVNECEAKTAKLEEEDLARVGVESPEFKELQDQATSEVQKLRELEEMLAAQGSELTHSLSELEKLAESVGVTKLGLDTMTVSVNSLYELREDGGRGQDR